MKRVVPVSFRIFSACLLLILTFVISSQAQARTRVCAERVKMTKFLNGKYKENPRAIGVSATGKSVLEIYTSLEGSWTVLMTTASGLTCIMGAGHSWQDKDQTQYLPKS